MPNKTRNRSKKLTKTTKKTQKKVRNFVLKNKTVQKKMYNSLAVIAVFALAGLLLLRLTSAAPGDPLTNQNLDINGDGTVGIVDLSQLLSQWNSAGPSADFNGDGTVNIIDMSQLLAQWGHVGDHGPVDPPTGVAFFDDFSTNSDWKDRYDFAVDHRDDTAGTVAPSWIGDHIPNGPNESCTAPEEKRTVNRGERSEGFNDEWIYRCAPGGDTTKAHIMTSVGPTSGYSIGGFAPKQVFADVTEVRWDVNQTDLGARQWTEVLVMPAASYDITNLPCHSGLPCGDNPRYGDSGGVGTHWTGNHSRLIATSEQEDGYTQSNGPRGYRCSGCSYETGRRFGTGYGVGDPALTSIRIRRQNFFRDNQDGTVTWGFELYDQPGEFEEFTVPGSFPEGPTRVVFKDHNYNPLKSPSILLPETTFTWHWDNISVR